MKNIIVTGGCGFIGSNFIKKIINKNYNIVNIDNLTYASNINYLNEIRNEKNYFFYKVNILKKNKIIEIFKRHKPLYVFNFAAETHVDNSILDSFKFLETNILGTYYLLNAVLEIKDRLDKKFKFIHISTDEVFGDVDGNTVGSYVGIICLEGLELGCDDGCDVGFVGCDDGCDEGFVGCDDGCDVGLVGCDDGCDVGLVGCVVGFDDGCEEGCDIGCEDGCEDGFDEG
jgi:hypothetical protein